MGSSYFYYTKDNGTVRFISDFRELNKTIKNKPFPIPKHSRFMSYGPMMDCSLFLVRS